MPREGEGHISDNATENQDPIIHGTGKEPTSDHVDRADKTAEMPEPEKVKCSRPSICGSGPNANGGL